MIITAIYDAVFNGGFLFIFPDREFLFRSAENGLNIFHVDTQTKEELLSKELMVGLVYIIEGLTVSVSTLLIMYPTCN